MKNLLLKGEHIEIQDLDNLIEIWFNKRTRNFVLSLNSEIIKATKTFKPIQIKLETIKNI